MSDHIMAMLLKMAESAIHLAGNRLNKGTPGDFKLCHVKQTDLVLPQISTKKL
jgi:hypothetical protein